jgi:sulfur oxidation c-type cytochrome SoxA
LADADRLTWSRTTLPTQKPMPSPDVNGRIHDVQADPATPLLWVLHEQLGLTGTQYGCGIGCGIAQCGACNRARRRRRVPQLLAALVGGAPPPARRHHRVPDARPEPPAQPGLGQLLHRRQPRHPRFARVRPSRRGAAARHPRWDAATGRPIDLLQRMAACRERHQQAPGGEPEGAERLALAAFVGHASRGLPARPDDDSRLAPARERGRALFAQRLGQLGLSCADCHDARWGARLGGRAIPQGRANGYPLYRLEWPALGSLQRRLRSGLAGGRAQPWPPDAPEYVALALHLQARGAGLPVETPAVRP